MIGRKKTPCPAPNSLGSRVLDLVEGDGRKPAAICKAAGLSDSVIRDLIRRPHQSTTLSTIQKLAAELKTTPEWLAYGISNRSSGAVEIPLLGEVAAGVWRSIDASIFADARASISIPAHESYPAEAQFDLLVRGSSLSKIARDGDYIRCVSTTRADIAVRTGDIVIVERRRDQDGEIETTAKKLRQLAEKDELWPVSDDPKWTTPIIVEHNKDDSYRTISIIAVVLFAFRNIGLN